jgi:class 3 adenylate cyclase
MIGEGVCPVLVERDEELAILEDALLEARGGDGRLVLLAGEAGIGKTRLARELGAQARRLGCAVLRGACSEAEISLPYLPLVEAIGNFLATEGADSIARELGPARSPLAQLFPQLGDGGASERSGDPGQAKLRLFESIVALLVVAASDRGLLLVVEDAHWADESTLELLEHLARRVVAMPALVLITYRSDELHRRHPLAPALRSWRRSAVATEVELEPLPPQGAAEMIAAIRGPDAALDRELVEALHRRSEGNPFVLEEMLREASERLAADTAGRPGAGEIGIPATVREAILLRVERLGDQLVSVLEAAAAMGHELDEPTLVEVAQAPQADVRSALTTAVQQQLVEADPDHPGRYRWRHALTQEAIYTDIPAPRRQAIHGRAAEALAARAPPVELARHLLGAGRFEDAVPVCLRAADEAERTFAYLDAISLLERALPHVQEPLLQARLGCRMGRARWLNGESQVAARLLADGIEDLDRAGEATEAAGYRIVLGRCLWEGERPDLARIEYERARDVLAEQGPSAELALAHMRIAGLDGFELDYAGCLANSERAVEIAEAAGADFERVWALSFAALGLLDSGDHERGFEVLDRCEREAIEKGYWFIAHNAIWNDVWTRTHMLEGGLEERLGRFDDAARLPVNEAGRALLGSYVGLARGDLPAARRDAEQALELYDGLGYAKMAWRSRVQLAGALAELGRQDEAAGILPSTDARTELQDIVYDAAPQIRIRLASRKIEEAAELAREILADARRLATYRETLALGVEALVAAGALGDAEALVEIAAAHPTSAGVSYVDEMRGRLLVARDDRAAAVTPLDDAVTAARGAGYPLVELRRLILLAEARAEAGGRELAERILREVAARTDRAAAARIRAEADAAAARIGISLPPAAPPRAEPEDLVVTPVGERLVTSMFADVRGYTSLSADCSPGELSERLAALYRHARVAVGRRGGIVDKFAGDAVMATFNATGTEVDHCVSGLEAAISLREKAALLGLPLGIGIAVGPAVLRRGSDPDNVAVHGEATNLAARLQGAAGPGEVILSEAAHRRVRQWLSARRLRIVRVELELKGFEGRQPAYRLPPADVAAGAGTSLAGSRPAPRR